MNVRKPVDYGTMHRELTAILAQNLPQMGEVYAIGKGISQRPEKGAAVAAAEFLQANFPDRRLRLPGAGREGQQHACGQYECKILFHDKFPPVVGSTVQFGKQIRREIFRQVKI